MLDAHNTTTALRGVEGGGCVQRFTPPCKSTTPALEDKRRVTYDSGVAYLGRPSSFGGSLFNWWTIEHELSIEPLEYL